MSDSGIVFGSVAEYDQVRMEAIDGIRKARTFAVVTQTDVADPTMYEQRFTFGLKDEDENTPSVLVLMLLMHWQNVRDSLGVSNEALLDMLDHAEKAAGDGGTDD